MLVLSRRERLRARFGFLTGAFLAGYAVARIIGEFFRQPDAFLGFLLCRRDDGPAPVGADADRRRSG